MELGGVGKAEACLPEGAGLAATAAKLFLPAQKLASRGFGMLTESVLPAKAKEMLELLGEGMVQGNGVPEDERGRSQFLNRGPEGAPVSYDGGFWLARSGQSAGTYLYETKDDKGSESQRVWLIRGFGAGGSSEQVTATRSLMMRAVVMVRTDGQWTVDGVVLVSWRDVVSQKELPLQSH